MPKLDPARYDVRLAGAPHRWGDYAVGEKIDHADAMTLEEAEHQIATRLYQNTAKVHFNQHEQAQGQFKRRLVYGGVVISLARALSFNGLATPSTSPPSTAGGTLRPALPATRSMPGRKFSKRRRSRAGPTSAPCARG